MERVYEKYGWVIYLALGLLWLVVCFYQTFSPDGLIGNDVQRVTGMSLSELEASNPVAIELVRFVYGGLGNLKINWSLLVLAITLTGYRKGKKWAWYTLWLVPVVLVSGGIFNAIFFSDVNQSLESIPIVSISLVGLLIPYRKFFPRKPQSGNV